MICFDFAFHVPLHGKRCILLFLSHRDHAKDQEAESSFFGIFHEM